MTWDDARKFCERNNARLAEPTDPMMARAIANLFPHHYPPIDGKTYFFQQKHTVTKLISDFLAFHEIPLV